MPTTTQINAADTTLSAVAQAQWQTLIRASAAYKEQPGLFPNLTGKLASVTAIQARQLNAALALIDGIGDGTVALTGGSDAVDYSQERDRDALVSYGLSVLYDQPLRKSRVAMGQMNTVTGCCSVCGLFRCSHFRPC
jgi:hypothetical protein